MRFMYSFMKFLFVSVFLVFSLYPMAQPGTNVKIKVDIKRQLFHDYIDREQKNALKADGTADGAFKILNGDEEINFLITQSLTKKVDQLQTRIETDTAFVHNQKVGYLRGMENMLKNGVSQALLLAVMIKEVRWQKRSMANTGCIGVM